VTILSFILPSYLHLQIIGYNCVANQRCHIHGQDLLNAAECGGRQLQEQEPEEYHYNTSCRTAQTKQGSDGYELVGTSPEDAATSTKAVPELTDATRARVAVVDIFLTVGGIALCVVATAVTTIGFLGKVSGNGGSCT
jgi:hypothetical protein